MIERQKTTEISINFTYLLLFPDNSTRHLNIYLLRATSGLLNGCWLLNHLLATKGRSIEDTS